MARGARRRELSAGQHPAPARPPRGSTRAAVLDASRQRSWDGRAATRLVFIDPVQRRPSDARPGFDRSGPTPVVNYPSWRSSLHADSIDLGRFVATGEIA